MNHPDFTALRRKIDAAITYDDRPQARKLAEEGLRLAGEKECLGEVMYFRAQQEIIEENFPEAVACLDKAITYNPSDGAAYNDLALCMVEMGQIEGVEELFDKGIEVESDYATIRHNKGWFLNKLGRHHEALACFEKALELEPGRAVTYENMADALENMGQAAEALICYRKALECVDSAFGKIRDQIRGEIGRLEGKSGPVR